MRRLRAAPADREAEIVDDAAGGDRAVGTAAACWSVLILPVPAVAGGGWLGWSHAEPQALTACQPLLRTLCDMKHLEAATEALTAAAVSVDVEERLVLLARTREQQWAPGTWRHGRAAPSTACVTGCVTAGRDEDGGAAAGRWFGVVNTQTSQIYEGTNQIQRVVMARQVLK